jgi:hypothetical protein
VVHRERREHSGDWGDAILIVDETSDVKSLHLIVEIDRPELPPSDSKQ